MERNLVVVRYLCGRIIGPIGCCPAAAAAAAALGFGQIIAATSRQSKEGSDLILVLCVRLHGCIIDTILCTIGIVLRVRPVTLFLLLKRMSE